MAWAEDVADALHGLGETAYDEAFGPLTATVPADHWSEALTLARDRLGCAFFDWLSAVDELEQGFSVLCHVARPRPGEVRHLLLRTAVPREAPTLPSAAGVYAGAGWHERETTEMFGIGFTPPEDGTMAEAAPTRHLLLPEEFEGHPLRKDFVLASRVVKPWPGAKEPGESDAGGPPSRRRTRPPGVPDTDTWGPREPGSQAPDPLAHAQPGPARPRRAPRERRQTPSEGQPTEGQGPAEGQPTGGQGPAEGQEPSDG